MRRKDEKIWRKKEKRNPTEVSIGAATYTGRKEGRNV
jgi:hypothetical protein